MEGWLNNLSVGLRGGGGDSNAGSQIRLKVLANLSNKRLEVFLRGIFIPASVKGGYVRD